MDRNVRKRNITAYIRSQRLRRQTAEDESTTPSPPRPEISEIGNRDFRNVYSRGSRTSMLSSSEDNVARMPSPLATIGMNVTSGSSMPKDVMFDVSGSSYSTGDDDEEGDNAEDGAPFNEELLSSYQWHVARAVWMGEDRDMLVFHNRTLAVKAWKIENAEALEIIAASGLSHLPGILYEQLDEPLLAAFIERWHPETNTFHMPWGEMGITLHDGGYILGCPVTGRAIIPKCDGDAKEVLRVLGNILGFSGTANELKVAVNWNAGSVKASLVKEIVDVDRVRASKLARVYLWWLITNTLFADRNRTHGQASFIELLSKPSEAPQYAWGAAALAYLYRELGMSTRCDGKQMSGCLTLLQAWIYAYFPVFRPQVRRTWTPNEPHARRWIPKGVRGDAAKESLIEYRHFIDGLGAHSVNWLPFGPNPTADYHISSFSGVLQCRWITEAYMPDRFARQFGLSQGIPTFPLSPKKSVRTANPRDYKVEHEAASWVFEKGLQNDTFHGYDPAAVASQCSDDYLDWYIPRTHPRIMHEQLPPIQPPFGFDAYEATQRMAGTLVGYHRDVYDGTDAPDPEDVRKLADICDHMMPILSISR